MWPSCSVLSESTRESCIINSAPILITQLYQFCNQVGQLIKDAIFFFSCSQSKSNKQVTVPINVENEVSFLSKYSSVPTFNRSGTFNSVHYRLFIKDLLRLPGTLPMTKCLKKILSTTLHHTFLFTAKCKCFAGSTKNVHDFARGFFHFKYCLWVWKPNIWPVFCTGIEFPHSIFILYNPSVRISEN